MKIRDLMKDLQDFADRMPSGQDAEVILYDRATQKELRVDPDTERFDFEVLRGDDEVCIEIV